MYVINVSDITFVCTLLNSDGLPPNADATFGGPGGVVVDAGVLHHAAPAFNTRMLVLNTHGVWMLYFGRVPTAVVGEYVGNRMHPYSWSCVNRLTLLYN